MGRFLLGLVIGILVLPAIAAFILMSGRFPIAATEKPPEWERRIANKGLDPAVERAAGGLTNPLQASDENLIRGMKSYREDCAGCHGDRGKPSSWGRNNFYPPAPQLFNRGVHDPVPNIFVIVKNGIRYTGMGGWKGQDPDDELWGVSMFLHAIRTLPPAVDSAWNAEVAADSLKALAASRPPPAAPPAERASPSAGHPRHARKNAY